MQMITQIVDLIPTAEINIPYFIVSNEHILTLST